MPSKSNVLREWTFWIRTGLHDECRVYLELTKLKELRAQPGCQRAAALFRDLGDGSTEVAVVSAWDSMASVRAFAGAEPLRPTIAPGDRKKLIDREPTVRHYLATDRSAIGIVAPERRAAL
ncbi:MAG: hypothetical protein JWQ73_3289 [Variovorax sp.]|nr:hypothetical protein [Variovorax sp.]